METEEFLDEKMNVSIFHFPYCDIIHIGSGMAKYIKLKLLRRGLHEN